MSYKTHEEGYSALDEEVQEPDKYRIVLLNDDYTTKDFVVAILKTIFHKGTEDAVAIMEEVHKKGNAVVGVYSYDIAATRAALVHSNAKANGFPLQCVLEKV